MDNWLPQGTRSRRAFVVLVLTGCVFLGLLRFVVSPAIFGFSAPGVGAVVDETLGNIIATALAATALALVLLWIIPPPNRPAVVESVPPHEITALLERGFPDSRMWWFDGSTGRFQRAATLPAMGRFARRDGVSREVTLVILDPSDEALCERYANYRKGLTSGVGRDWTVANVRRDLYATLLAAKRYNDTEPLTITIGLKGNMSILRYDLSDSRLVITKEGKRDPAISCPDGSFYYNAYLEDLRWSLKQARRVDLGSRPMPPGGFDRDSAREALVAMGVHTSDVDRDEFVDAVLIEAASTTHPYG